MRTSEEIRSFRKKLKRSPTPSEVLFRERLKQSGIEFSEQMIFGFYILDFVVHTKALCIELDGSAHKGRENYDRLRDEFVRKCGLRVVRLKNEEAMTYDIKKIIKRKDVPLAKFRSALAKANSYRGKRIAELRAQGKWE